MRKSLFFAPPSFVEGWAHYCEQMMVGGGLQARRRRRSSSDSSPSRSSGSRGSSSAIRLHCEDMSVEQGMRFFRDEAFLEEATARREAERGTFDPTYLVYSAGKLAMLKLRRDYKEQQGGKFSLRAFHDAVLGAGQRAVLGAPAAPPRRHVGRGAGLRAGNDAVIRVSVRGL